MKVVRNTHGAHETLSVHAGPQQNALDTEVDTDRRISVIIHNRPLPVAFGRLPKSSVLLPSAPRSRLRACEHAKGLALMQALALMLVHGLQRWFTRSATLPRGRAARCRSGRLLLGSQGLVPELCLHRASSPFRNTDGINRGAAGALCCCPAGVALEDQTCFASYAANLLVASLTDRSFGSSLSALPAL